MWTNNGEFWSNPAIYFNGQWAEVVTEKEYMESIIEDVKKKYTIGTTIKHVDGHEYTIASEPSINCWNAYGVEYGIYVKVEKNSHSINGLLIYNDVDKKLSEIVDIYARVKQYETYWFINQFGERVHCPDHYNNEYDDYRFSIGNYSRTKKGLDKYEAFLKTYKK
jgi:hypothetical protein